MNISEVFEEKQTTITGRLKSLLDQNLPVVVAGAGNLGRKIVSFLVKKDLNFYSFTDNNPKRWGEKINDKTILSPREVSENLKETAIWIVGIWSPGHSYVSTKQQLQSLGVTNIFPAAALMQLFPDDLLPHYHFETPEYFFKSKNKIKEVYESLADEESKRQYLAHLDSRVNLNFEGLPQADTKNQYFPSGIVTLSDQEVFLDAGAYDGDTLEQFSIRTKGVFSKYIALEPDPDNYKKLLDRVSKFPEGKVEVSPYAVGDENGTLKFNATGGEGAAISETGSVSVECRRIDDLFYNYNLTYLKFDIEGAELGALKGAKNTIIQYKPKLAVCLYHLPDDIWTIPLLIKEYNRDYSLFVRTHSLDGFEFVLYAIPK